MHAKQYPGISIPEHWIPPHLLRHSRGQGTLATKIPRPSVHTMQRRTFEAALRVVARLTAGGHNRAVMEDPRHLEALGGKLS